MKLVSRLFSFIIIISVGYVTIGCGNDGSSGPRAGTGIGSIAGNSTNPISGVGGATNTALGGNGPIAGKGTAGATTQNGGKGASGVQGAGNGGNNAGAGGGAAGTGGNGRTKLPPSVRAAGFESMAPPLGEPIPKAKAGEWKYLEVEGAKSRDGSSAGFYYKFSDTSKNLMIFLMGGGACYENFSCTCNPPNKDYSLTADMVLTGVGAIVGADAVPQDPNTAGWFEGAIFSKDPANPVADWNMVFVPYVTGDVFAGNRENATVAGYDGVQQFAGRTNMIKFMSRILPTFLDAEVVLLTGTSAGGIGSMLNAAMVIDGFIDHGTAGARGFIVNDAGGIFDDKYMEPCLQKLWRDTFNLNEILPKDCKECFNADGGGLVSGLGPYLMKRYPDLTLGGIVDSTDDQAMSMFLCYGLNNCSPDNWLPLTLLEYPDGRYRDGLTDFVNNRVDKKRFGSYIWDGLVHQNLIVTATGDRFFSDNGTNMTIAAWLTKILQGETVHVGLVAN